MALEDIEGNSTDRIGEEEAKEVMQSEAAPIEAHDEQVTGHESQAPLKKAPSGLVNKRIDFDKDTLDAIASITPCFEFDDNLSQNEIIGAVIKESVMLAKSACKVDEEILSLLVGISDLSKALKCEDEARDKTAKALRSILKEIVG